MSAEPEGVDTGRLDAGVATMPNILRQILEARQRWLLESSETMVAFPPASQPPPLRTAGSNAFLAALESRRGRAVIAEVKLGSPRLGNLTGRIDPEAQARAYAAGGAAALSVVVEPDFFHGSYDLLSDCKEASGLPVIAKDFVVDALQLRLARRHGADAVLLIAALLSRSRLRELATTARSLGLVPLVEIHDEMELAMLDEAEWELVGVNNRDLRTFEVDLGHGVAMAPRLPPGALRVAESGIASPLDLARLRQAGYDAFLVGESLLLADSPEAKLRELLG